MRPESAKTDVSVTRDVRGGAEDPTSAAGRPRCAETKQAILKAVWRLHKITPLAVLTIEQIAREAGVGKATIYRWWDSKAAVALEAFLERYLPVTSLPEKGTAAERLHAQFRAVIGTLRRGDLARLAAGIIAEGQSHPEVLEMFRQRFVFPRRAATKALIEQGMASGEFDGSLDPDVAIDLMYGPVYFRLLVAHQPLDERFARELWSRVSRVILPDPQPGKKSSRRLVSR